MHLHRRAQIQSTNLTALTKFNLSQDLGLAVRLIYIKYTRISGKYNILYAMLDRDHGIIMPMLRAS